MKVPCELIVRVVLPTIRASMAMELVEKHGLSQKEAAEILGITTAAVSQYLSRKRATSRDREVFKSEEFDEAVRRAAEAIALGPGEVEAMREICRCCRKMREEGLLCGLHEEMSQGLDGCEFCLCSDEKT
jgi:predicted transcriptional regulator